MTGRRSGSRWWTVVRLVAVREVRERLRAKSLYVTTALLVVVIVALGIGSRFLGGDPPGPVDIGYVGPAATEVESVLLQSAEVAGREATVREFGDADSARSALEDDEVDVLVLADEREAVFADDVDTIALAIVQQAWSSVEIQRALTEAGLDADQIADALTPSPLEEVTLADGGGVEGLAILTGFAAALLLFGALQTFGTYVLTGTVEEKSTAVVELLLVRAAADQLLAGKVLGIGAVGLGQFAVAVLASMGSLLASGGEVPGAVWSAVPFSLVWFVGGYFLYATLFALAGSLVSRQEDAQSAAAPITYAMLGSYLLIFFLGYEPNSTAATLVSLIPFVAPMMMPMRMAAGAASPLEVALAVVLVVVTIVAAWKLAGRVYEQVLLQRGSRISWREAVATLRRR